MAVDTAALAALVHQTVQLLEEPLQDLIQSILDLNKVEDAGAKSTRTFASTAKLVGEGFPALGKNIADLGRWIDQTSNRSTWQQLFAQLGNLTNLAKTAAGVPVKGGLSGSRAAGDAATGVVGAFQQAFGSIVSMVSKVNPAAAERFEMAMNDLQAVMGEILLPVLEAGIKLVRQFADILLTIKPAFDPIIAVIVELVGIMADLLVPIFKVITPIIQLFGAVLQSLMPVVKFLSEIFGKMLGIVETVVKGIIRLWNELANSWVGRQLGLKSVSMIELDKNKLQSSMGKAVYGTGFAGGEELGKISRAAALKGGLSAADRTANATEQIKTLTEKMFPWLQKNATASETMSKELDRLFNKNPLNPL